MPSLFRNGRPRLFSTQIEPSCSYCEQGTPTQDGGAILCARCGVVTPAFFCKRFRYDPISRVVRPQILRSSFEKEDFDL